MRPRNESYTPPEPPLPKPIGDVAWAVEQIVGIANALPSNADRRVAIGQAIVTLIQQHKLFGLAEIQREVSNAMNHYRAPIEPR